MNSHDADDYNRVVLDPDKDTREDYINASYIDVCCLLTKFVEPR